MCLVTSIYVLAWQETCLTRHALDKNAPSLAAELLHPAAEDSQQQDMPQPQARMQEARAVANL